MPEWRALWQRHPHATPFQSPEWLWSWWSCFGNSSPVVVTARKDDELVGVLPLYLFDEPGRRKLLPFGISLSDYLDALIDLNYPGCASALLASLVDVSGWDECYLPELSPSAALLSAECPSALLAEKQEGETCPVVQLPQQAEGLPSIVPRKTLRDLRQARQRAASTGGVAIARAESATVTALMHEFFRVHESRWRQRAGQGVCADPIVRSFHLAAAQRMLKAGMLRLYVLRVGDVPVAAYYGFIAKHTAYAYLGGFDPDYGVLSPGAQLIGHAIEEAIREGAHELHFLRGGEGYKYAWGAVDRPNTTLALRRRC